MGIYLLLVNSQIICVKLSTYLLSCRESDQTIASACLFFLLAEAIKRLATLAKHEHWEQVEPASLAVAKGKPPTLVRLPGNL